MNIDRNKLVRLRTDLRDDPALPCVGRYRLIRPIGQGAAAVVYLADDVELRRLVAVKLLRDERVVRRFYREATAVAKLRHPNIITIHDTNSAVDEQGRSTHCIVMEYVEGGTLADATLSIRERLEVLEKVTRAVHFAHERGIVHRDLKPQNILLDGPDRPVVTDFGLAKLAEGASVETVEGAFLGTPAYMSPEQVRGHAIDARSDVYSLGAMLYEMLRGAPPFSDATGAELLQKVLQEEPPLPAGAPQDLATICRKAMERDVRSRYQTAEELAADLRRYLNGEPVQARPLGLFHRVGRWTRRKPWIVAAGAWTLLTVAAAAFVFVREAHRSRAEEALDRAEAFLDQAERLEEGGRWDGVLWEDSLRKAQEEIERSRLHRKMSRSHLVEGRLHMLRESWEEATVAFGRAFGAVALTWQARAWLELCCGLEGEYTYFGMPGVDGSPEAPNPTSIRASEEQRRTWAQLARGALQRAATFGLSLPDTASVQAIQSFLDGDLEKLQKIASESGDDEYVVRLLAEAHHRAQRAGTAIEEYRKVAMRRPNAARHHVRLALFHIEAKQFEDAVREADRSLELAPTRIDGRFFRGIARNRAWIEQRMRTESDARQAAEDLATVLESTPSRELRQIAGLARGNALYHLWQITRDVAYLEDAVRHRRASLEINPSGGEDIAQFQRGLRLWEEELRREKK